MVMDISEVFTLAVREVAPRALSKGLSFSFDYRGPRPLTCGNALAMKLSLQQLFECVVDLLELGLIVFDAETRRNARGRCVLHVKAAGSGKLASPARQAEWLDRLTLQEAAHGSGDRPRLSRASGICPATGATIEFVGHPAEGLLFTLQSDALQRCDEALPSPAPPPLSANARAWLVHHDATVSGSLARRLSRLGWTIGVLSSVHEVRARLHTLALATPMPMPALVIVIESAVDSLAEVLALRPLLAAWTRCIYAVAADSPTLQRGQTLRGFELRPHPLGPAELDEMSSWLSPDERGPSCETFPVPLRYIVRPRMLVVDPDAVARLVAAGMAQCLGHEVATAGDGLQAIDNCLRAPPSVILMALDMPRMNGLQATRHIRALQRSGALPPCRILATPQGGSSDLHRVCLAAGMDGCLPKPLFLAPLRCELRRVCVDANRQR